MMRLPPAASVRDRLRQLLANGQVARIPPVWDVASARAAEEAGIGVAMVPGSLVALARLAVPDVGLVTPAELCDQVYAICRAAALTLLVDADHGGGNALNVYRTIAELEAAGAAAATIEDTLMPPRFGAENAVEVVSIAEAAGKIAAARAASHDLLVGARLNLAGIPDNEIPARVAAYEAAGPDFLFLARLGRRAQLEAAAASTRLPIITGPLPEALDDDELLRRAGVRGVLAGHHIFEAMLQTLFQAYKPFASRSADVLLPVDQMARSPWFDEAAVRFLRPSEFPSGRKP